MKTFKILSITLTLLLIALPASLTAQDRVDENDIVDMVERNVVPTIQKTEVSGSPYVTEDFTNGSFEVFSGRYADAEYMNFNIYENRLEYRSGNQTYGVDLANIRQFNLKVNGEEMLFKRGFESKRLDGDDFVEVAADGALSFLIKHEVNFSENVSSGYGSATKQASYSHNERYYFKEGDDVSYERKLNNRRVMRYFDGNKEVESYIEERGLDMSNPADVAMAVSKFNEVNS
jgi:hypothetical protein